MACQGSVFKTKEFLEEKPNVEFPTEYKDSLYYEYWKERTVLGQQLTLIHPKFKEFINTPVSVGLTCLQHMCDSNMCLRGCQHLIMLRERFYQRINRDIQEENALIDSNATLISEIPQINDKNQVDTNDKKMYYCNNNCKRQLIDIKKLNFVPGYINGHKFEEKECNCVKCMKERYPEEYKKEAYEYTKNLIQNFYETSYPEYERISIPNQREERILMSMIDKDFYTLFCVPNILPSLEAEEEMNRMIINNELNTNEELLKFFTLSRGLSEYEDKKGIEYNSRLLEKAYKKGKQKYEKLIEKEYTEKGLEIWSHIDNTENGVKTRLLRNSRKKAESKLSAIKKDDYGSSDSDEVEESDNESSEVEINTVISDSESSYLSDLVTDDEENINHISIPIIHQRQKTKKLNHVQNNYQYIEKNETIHLGEYRCIYKDCNYKTENKEEYDLHIQDHRKNAKFKCTYPGCSYATTTNSHLQTHLRTHTGEKPYKCTYPGCSYAATTNDHLQTHLRTHTGEKPYKCTYSGCSYAATTNTNLQRHLRTHTGEKPYKCTYPGCSYAAIRNDYLRKHINTFHSKEEMRE
ncbi:hypothetical protein WA158_002158 [Blastocystis sp. Blastoise]